MIPTEEEIAETMGAIMADPESARMEKIEAARVVWAYWRARTKSAGYTLKAARNAEKGAKAAPPHLPETEEEFAATALGAALLSLTDGGAILAGGATDVLGAILGADPTLAASLGRTTLAMDLAASGVGRWLDVSVRKEGRSNRYRIARFGTPDPPKPAKSAKGAKATTPPPAPACPLAPHPLDIGTPYGPHNLGPPPDSPVAPIRVFDPTTVDTFRVKGCVAAHAVLAIFEPAVGPLYLPPEWTYAGGGWYRRVKQYDEEHGDGEFVRLRPE